MRKSEFLELVSGGKVRTFMRKKTRYSNAPKDISEAILKSTKIKDFLPPPEKLVPREKNVKITISLSEHSIDFFKEEAKRLGVPYQTMIKKVLDAYSDYYEKTGT